LNQDFHNVKWIASLALATTASGSDASVMPIAIAKFLATAIGSH
jgi:hypothetical protein